MFTTGVSKTYQWPVDVKLVAEDGKEAALSFTAVFKRLPNSEIEQIQLDAAAGNMPDQEVVDRVMAGWGDDITTPDGKPLAFTKKNLDAVCEIYPVRDCIVTAYLQSIAEARIKNLKVPAGIGHLVEAALAKTPPRKPSKRSGRRKK